MERIFTALAIAFTALLISPLHAQAQETGALAGTVTGTESGETVPGVNVAIPSLSRGAATNTLGEYTIEGIQPGTYTVRVSFVGYQTSEAEVTISAGETTTRNFELTSSAVGLDEVVVTGYGTQRRANFTGSVASLNSEEVNDVPVQSTSALLQGRAAGVQVSTTSGNPGGGFEVNIRGEGSINAGDDPLYIVDGVQMSFSASTATTDRNPLNAINPRDIESIEVLKDAAAAAIYGAQAANGVVLITTKSGRPGETRISLNFETGTRFQSERFNLMNRDEWIEFQEDAYGEETFREGILTDFGYAADTPYDQVRDFDWQDWLFQPGSHFQAGFSATGGSDATQFYLSGSWAKTEAAVRRVEYNQLNFSSRINHQFSERLNLGVRATINNEDDIGACQDGFFINCPFYQSIGEEPPISFPYLDGELPAGFRAEADGSYNPFTEQSPTTNPAVFLNETDPTADITQIIGSINPTYTILPWLTARGQVGIDYQYIKESDYESTVASPANGGNVYRRFNTLTNVTANATLEAQQTFARDHDVNVLATVEYRREYEEAEGTTYEGFNNDLLRVPSAATSTNFFFGNNSEYRVFGYVGQARYNYNDRYLLSVTGRYDATSRFGEDQRWGFFPSASVGWRISEEPFFEADFIDNLKLRFSYGVTGNSLIGGDSNPDNFAARGLYDVGGSYGGLVGIRPGQLANPLLSWEEAREFNFGTDVSLWLGRVTASLDLYTKTNDNLLLSTPLPVESGFVSYDRNVGAVRNRGIELQIKSVNVQTENFRWSTRFNIGINQNEVLRLSEDVEELFPGSTNPVAVGHALEAWKVPLWAGVNPADGRPLYYDADGNLTYTYDNADDAFYDGGEEDAEGGIGTSFGYKGLSLDLFFAYSYGGTGLPNTQRTWTQAFGEGILGDLVDGRWREPGDVASYPRSTPSGLFDNADSPSGITSRWLYSTNYFRLRNATLAYQLPGSLLGPVGFRNARIYATGVNLFTWSSYLGIDPELAEAFESSSYPAEQQINIGLEVTL